MYKVAILGSTGRVGTEMIKILEEREFPISSLHLLASEKSKGKRLKFKEEDLKVEAIDQFDFAGIDIVLSTAGANISKKYIPEIVKKGAVVIDNTSCFRTDPDIPLVIPEINPHKVADYTNTNIIANPNCTTIQMLVAVNSLHNRYGIRRIVASTYQSVSGAGNEASDELFNQTRSLYTQTSMEKKVFTKQIAFNVIPHIDVFLEDGSTKEEWKMGFETQKIMEGDILVSATCVRVPVFIGHSISLNIEFEGDINEEEVREILKTTSGVSLVDYRADEGYVTPFEAAGEDKVYVSRLRVDSTKENTLSMWVVADNIRKGAALNSIQIAEELIKII